MADYGLQKCLNKWCGALFKPGGWATCLRLSPDDTTGSHGGIVSRIPDNVCPICRKPFTLT